MVVTVWGPVLQRKHDMIDQIHMLLNISSGLYKKIYTPQREHEAQTEIKLKLIGLFSKSWAPVGHTSYYST